MEYHFKVAAINAVGTGELSPVLTCLAAVVPSEPQNFEVTGSNTGTVSVQWQPPQYDGGSPLLGYFIYNKITGTETYSKTAIISSEVFDTTLTSLTANQQYSLKIVAVNVKGESNFSHVQYQYAGAVPSDLLPPTEMTNTRTFTSIMI